MTAMNRNVGRVGRPPVPEESRNRAEQLLRDGVAPKDVARQTGIGKTLVYELRRLVNATTANENTPDPTGPGCLSISPKEEPNAYNQSNSSTVFLP